MGMKPPPLPPPEPVTRMPDPRAVEAAEKKRAREKLASSRGRASTRLVDDDHRLGVGGSGQRGSGLDFG